MRGNPLGQDDLVRVGRGCMYAAVVYSSVLTSGGRLRTNPNSRLSSPAAVDRRRRRRVRRSWAWPVADRKQTCAVMEAGVLIRLRSWGFGFCTLIIGDRTGAEMHWLRIWIFPWLYKRSFLVLYVHNYSATGDPEIPILTSSTYALLSFAMCYHFTVRNRVSTFLRLNTGRPGNITGRVSS